MSDYGSKYDLHRCKQDEKVCIFCYDEIKKGKGVFWFADGPTFFCYKCICKGKLGDLIGDLAAGLMIHKEIGTDLHTQGKTGTELIESILENTSKRAYKSLAGSLSADHNNKDNLSFDKRGFAKGQKELQKLRYILKIINKTMRRQERTEENPELNLITKKELFEVMKSRYKINSMEDLEDCLGKLQGMNFIEIDGDQISFTS